MKTFARLMAVACCLAASAAAAYGCVCDPEVTAKKARERAEAVFSGTVVESHREMSTAGMEWRVRIKVDDFWKGEVGEEVIIYTDESDCAARFEAGRKYLVFARRQEGRGRLVTDTCMKTAPFDSGSEDVAKLGRPKRRAPREQ